MIVNSSDSINGTCHVFRLFCLVFGLSVLDLPVVKLVVPMCVMSQSGNVSCLFLVSSCFGISDSRNVLNHSRSRFGRLIGQFYNRTIYNSIFKLNIASVFLLID